MNRTYYVYILASRKNGALYIGVTGDLARRVHAHKEGTASKHTAKYGIHTLVYAETFGQIEEAIHRETCLKRWKREWKIALIEKSNPKWLDLYEGLH